MDGENISSLETNNLSYTTENTTIKEEIDDGCNIQIKSETESDYRHDDASLENPFENIQLHIKQETSMNIDKDDIDSQSNVSSIKIKSIEAVINDLKRDIVVEIPVPPIEKVEHAEIKNEEMGEDLVSCDYPNFDDSMDSNEAVALCQVEACLQDDVNLKNHGDENLDEYPKEELYKVIKDESDLTVTETHLISNKLIKTTSTVTNPQDGLIESRTTKTLVMEIRPMSRGNLILNKIGNPEEILPTNDSYNDYKEPFQLNSITGNVLSLEQEAFGLLKSKGKKDLRTKTHFCTKCTNVYTTRAQLRKHMGVHDTIEKRALGVLKGQQTRQENRKKKLKLEEELEKKNIKQEVKKEGYECTCGKIFRRRSRMETCLKSHNLFEDTDSYPCVTCTRQFKNKEELSLHRKRLHRKRFPCKFCPTDYNTRKELFKHLQIHQKVQLMEYKVISEVVKGKQKLKCFMCSKTYTELSDLKCHVMDYHKEPYSCRHCKRTFPKIIDFGNHTKTFHPEIEGQSVLDVLEAFSKLVQAWKCEECGLQFHEADKLALHQIEKHSPELKSDSQFQCTDCRRVFISQKGLTSHRRVHHNTESVEESQPEDIGVMCLECRKMCKDMNALTSHMRLHSPDRKYACKFCDFRFATQEKRRAHTEIHTGEMRYVCFICEYQCSSENRLKLHKMSLKHLNMKEFLLTGVPLVEEEQSSSKQEKIKETLRREEKTAKKRKKEKDREVSLEDVEVACDICGDKFPSESEMLEHKQTHPFIEFPNEDTPSRIFFK